MHMHPHKTCACRTCARMKLHVASARTHAHARARTTARGTARRTRTGSKISLATRMPLQVSPNACPSHKLRAKKPPRLHSTCIAYTCMLSHTWISWPQVPHCKPAYTCARDMRKELEQSQDFPSMAPSPATQVHDLLGPDHSMRSKLIISWPEPCTYMTRGKFSATPSM